MEIKRWRTLAIRIFRIFKYINQSFLKKIFTPKRDPKMRAYGVLVKHHKFEKYGYKGFTALGPKIWNLLPFNL